jgi:hypothetical protein
LYNVLVSSYISSKKGKNEQKRRKTRKIGGGSDNLALSTKSLVKALVLSTSLLFLVPAQKSSAAVLTTFQDALQPTTPAPGWSYLWNSGGEIGDPANYTSLLPTTSSRILYNTDGAPSLPSPDPGSFTFFGYVEFNGLPGGHPGQGTGQTAIERYAIAAYTLNNSGAFAITNGVLQNVDTSIDGLNFRIYANSDLIYSGITNSGRNSSLNFSNVPLGNLNSGDTIYVAIGSGVVDNFDSFSLEYSIETADNVVPEPTTIVASVFGGLTLLARKRRK